MSSSSEKSFRTLDLDFYLRVPGKITIGEPLTHMTTLARVRVRRRVADRLFLPYLTIHLTILAAVLCYPPYFWAAEHIFHICCFPCGI